MNPEYVYEFVLSFDLAQVSEPVKEVEETLNASLAEWGCEYPKVSIRSSSTGTITTSRPITEAEKKAIIAVMEMQSHSMRGKVESFRCQPGNVQQLAPSVA